MICDTTLLHDDFAGSGVNAMIWAWPTGAPSYYGRTQIQPWYPQVSNGSLWLDLETHNPTARVPGDSFYGSEIYMRQQFEAGPGLAFEARARLVEPLAGGLVGGLFLYGVHGRVQDEIDYELLSNDAAAGQPRVLTNVFDDGGISSSGDPAFAPLSGGLIGFHTYRVEWKPDSVRWLIDGQLVRVETDPSEIPDEPMALHLNLWAPNSGFAAAYNAGLQPAPSPSLNQVFFMEVDYARVEWLPPPNFDGLEYVASYPDLSAAFGPNGQLGCQHYFAYGWREGRQSSFDGLEYIASYLDLRDAFSANGDAGCWHYIVAGAREGRTTNFDGLEYVASYADLRAAFGANGDAGSWHYIVQGWREGRQTTFDGLEYIASHPDLIAALGANSDAGSWHYIVAGAREGRATTFDGLEYIASNADLIPSLGANSDRGCEHYIHFGHAENRSTDAFDAAQYLRNYADLRTVFGGNEEAATAHYIAFGFFEGRIDEALVA